MRNLEGVKALALDLDGTLLLPGPSMGEKTASVLRRLGETGMRLIFCTGRSPESLEPYRERSGAEGLQVVFNGALVVDMRDARLEVLDTAFLPAGVVEYCLGAGERAGVYTQIYAARENAGGTGFRAVLLAREDCPEARLYQGHTGTLPVFCDLHAALVDPANAGWIKVMFVHREAERLEAVRRDILRRFDFGAACVTRTSPVFLEILAGNAGKGAGLARVMERLGLAPAEVLACGDEENDLSLFAVAGHSAAPADASPPAKAAADFITAPCAEEGVAAFLETVFLRDAARFPVDRPEKA